MSAPIDKRAIQTAAEEINKLRPDLIIVSQAEYDQIVEALGEVDATPQN